MWRNKDDAGMKRRDFLKLSATTIGALGAAGASFAPTATAQKGVKGVKRQVKLEMLFAYKHQWPLFQRLAFFQLFPALRRH